MHLVESLAATNDLPDAILTDSGLKITPLDASVPQAAQRLIDQIAASLPHIKITAPLMTFISSLKFAEPSPAGEPAKTAARFPIHETEAQLVQE